MFRHNGQPVIPCKQKDTWPDMIYYIRWRTNHRVSITSLYDTTGHVRVVFLPIATYRSLIVWHNKVMHDINLVNYLLKSERTCTVLSLYYLLINKNKLKSPTYIPWRSPENYSKDTKKCQRLVKRELQAFKGQSFKMQCTQSHLWITKYAYSLFLQA